MAHRKTAKDARSVAFNKVADDEWLGDPLDAETWEAKSVHHTFNMPKSMLPKGARAVGFAELAEILKGSPDGHVRLEGIERGSAGLESHRITCYGYAEPDETAGSAFSFCIEGWTFTAFEDPGDGYSSSLAFLVAREGNFCAARFDPCSLLPRLRTSQQRQGDIEAESWRERIWALGEHSEGHADVFELVEPSTGRVALSVGTERCEVYYPRFFGYHNPELLALARAAGPIPAKNARKMRL